MFKEKSKQLLNLAHPLTKMLRLRQLLIAILVSAASMSSMAAEYISVQSNVAILYDAPSTQASKRFVVTQGYPFEVLVKLGQWTKVKDINGAISWIEADKGAAKRTLIVTQSGAEIREKPEAASKVIFRADKDLLLDFVESAPNGWVKVHHRDGETGYISSKQVWGT